MGNTINYGKMPASCDRADVQCNKEMSVGSFLMALDYVTTGTIDGIVSDAQIKSLLTSDGRLIDTCLEMVGKKFNELRPNNMQIAGVPYARDFKDFLLTNHRGVYDSVFGVSSDGGLDPSELEGRGVYAVAKPGTPTLSNAELAKRVATNLRRLATKLESVSKGTEQNIHQQDYFVYTYSNGFKLQESLSPSFIVELGGQANAERAKLLLEAAFIRFSSTYSASNKPCDRPIYSKAVPAHPDAPAPEPTAIDYSACYASTAQNLRQLASLVEQMNP